jgi:hypothetical protein
LDPTAKFRSVKNEKWIHDPKAAADLAAALTWSRANPPSGDDTEACLAKLDEQT